MVVVLTTMAAEFGDPTSELGLNWGTRCRLRARGAVVWKPRRVQDLPELSPVQALWRGTVTALVVALPCAVLNEILQSGGDTSDASAASLLFNALILFGAAAGGWATLRLSPEAHLSHAAGSGALTYLIVQGIGILSRSFRGEEISWIAYPLLLLLMATVAMFGGMFARRWNRTGGPG